MSADRIESAACWSAVAAVLTFGLAVLCAFLLGYVGVQL